MKDLSSSAESKIQPFDIYPIQPGRFSPYNQGIKFTCLYFYLG